MPLDTATLKARWGVTDSALDPLVESVALQAQALCESYCGRRFDHAADEGDFEPVNYSFQVPRFPITRLVAVHAWQTGQPPAGLTAGAPIHVRAYDAARGLVWTGWPGGPSPARMVHCQWEGGFETWPPDLQFAVTAAADIVWSDTPGGGAPPGSPGAAALGVVKKISVVGVYSAEIGSDPDSDPDGNNTWGILPPPVTAVLDRYRLAALIGIG